MSIPKPVGSITTARSTWSQTMRTLVRNGLNKAATLSRRTGRDVLGMRLSGNKGNTPESSSNTPQQLSSPPAVQLKKSSARRLPSVETEASGTGSSQTWEDCGKEDLFPIFPRFLCPLVSVVMPLTWERGDICWPTPFNSKTTAVRPFRSRGTLFFLHVGYHGREGKISAISRREKKSQLIRSNHLGQRAIV